MDAMPEVVAAIGNLDRKIARLHHRWNQLDATLNLTGR